MKLAPTSIGTKLPPAIKRNGSFTLIELLAVVAILALLAAMAFKVAGYAKQKMNISRAQAEIASLEMVIERFKFDNGQYPTSSTVRALGDFSGGGTMSPVITNGVLLYTQLVSPQRYYNFRPSQLMVFTNTTTIIFGTSTQSFSAFTCIIDPWGHPYNYYRTYPVLSDQVNKVTFDLWSSGPNCVNENGKGDDITNWRR